MEIREEQREEKAGSPSSKPQREEQAADVKEIHADDA